MTDRDRLEEQFQQTLALVRASDPKFFFDREGRPGALAAIRGALPSIQRELLDAVIEDATLGREAEEMFLADLDGSREVTL